MYSSKEEYRNESRRNVLEKYELLLFHVPSKCFPCVHIIMHHCCTYPRGCIWMRSEKTMNTRFPVKNRENRSRTAARTGNAAIKLNFLKTNAHCTPLLLHCNRTVYTRSHVNLLIYLLIYSCFYLQHQSRTTHPVHINASWWRKHCDNVCGTRKAWYARHLVYDAVIKYIYE